MIVMIQLIRCSNHTWVIWPQTWRLRSVVRAYTEGSSQIEMETIIVVVLDMEKTEDTKEMWDGSYTLARCKRPFDSLVAISRWCVKRKTFLGTSFSLNVELKFANLKPPYLLLSLPTWSSMPIKTKRTLWHTLPQACRNHLMIWFINPWYNTHLP